MKLLVVRNRQRTRPVRLPPLRRLATALLETELALTAYDLEVHLVGRRTMARLNESYLQHQGPTDVLTFDYAALPSRPPSPGRSGVPSSVHGEIFICVPVAQDQARTHRASWESEMVRYLIHGVLHLLGYDDMTAEARRVMKKRENQLLRRAVSRHSLPELGL